MHARMLTIAILSLPFASLTPSGCLREPSNTIQLQSPDSKAAPKSTSSPGTNTPNNSIASQPSARPDLTEILTRIDELAKRMPTREEVEQIVSKRVGESDQELANRLDGLAKRTSVLEETMQSTARRIDGLEVRLGALEDKLNQIIRESSGGDPILALRGQMDKPEFRDEFRSAVRDVAPQGTLIIANDTDTSRTVRVNGDNIEVPAFTEISKSVPAGVLITELRAFEPAKTWTLGPDNDYTQKIRIHMRAISWIER